MKMLKRGVFLLLLIGIIAGSIRIYFVNADNGEYEVIEKTAQLRDKIVLNQIEFRFVSQEKTVKVYDKSFHDDIGLTRLHYTITNLTDKAMDFRKRPLFNTHYEVGTFNTLAEGYFTEERYGLEANETVDIIIECKVMLGELGYGTVYDLDTPFTLIIASKIGPGLDNVLYRIPITPILE